MANTKLACFAPLGQQWSRDDIFIDVRSSQCWSGLRHVLCMHLDRMVHMAIFKPNWIGWIFRSGSQPFTWFGWMKKLTRGHSHVRWSRLHGWSLNDSRTLWLETLMDMAADRSQWCTYSFHLNHFLSSIQLPDLLSLYDLSLMCLRQLESLRYTVLSQVFLTD